MIKLKIAICFHLGYIDRFFEFTPYIDHVLTMFPQTELYITYRERQDPTKMCQQKYPNAHVMRSKRGCDCGAFLKQIRSFSQRHQYFDYIFKLHTKSNNQYWTDWKESLLQPIAGSPEIIKQILLTFVQRPQISMIASQRWIIPVEETNNPFLTQICQRNHLHSNGSFIGGTIFWLRGSIIEQLSQNISLKYEYKLCEHRKPNEPSHTHAWERVFGLMVTNYGGKIVGWSGGTKSPHTPHTQPK